MKLKAIAAAIAMVAAGNASAAIIGPGAGNSNLVLTAYDTVTNVGYVRKLNITASQFLTQYTGTDGTSTTMTSGAPFTFAADALFTSAFSNTANVVWSISGGDGDALGGTFNSVGTLRVLSTVPTGSLTTGTSVPMSNTQLNTIIGGTGSRFQTFVDQVNANTTCATADSCVIAATDIANGWHPGNTSVWGDDWSVGTALKNNGPIGALDFFLLTGGGGGGTAQTQKGAFGFSGVRGVWTLNANGSGEFSAVPVPAAVWLLGSAIGGLGVFSRRRRRV